MGIARTGFTEYNSNYSSFSASYTCDSYYRGLVVAIRANTDNTSGPNTLSVTYGGVALTKVLESSLGYSHYKFVAIYVLENPAQGSNTLSITTGASGGTIYGVRIASYKNVSQTALVNAYMSDTDPGGTDTWYLTTTVDGCWGVSHLFDYPGSGGTDYTGGTNVVLLGTANEYRYADSNASLGAAGSKTFTASYNANDDWGYSTIAIAPALAISLLTTDAVTNIAQTSAYFSGEAYYDGDLTISQRGFVYGTSTNPTISNSKIVTGGTLGTYGVSVTGLTLNTTYYVRAFATNSDGTGYGNEVSFTTLNIPQYELQKDIGATEGETYLGQINVTGTTGTITVKLGSTGTETVINAGAGVSAFSGVYSGLSGLIITRSADFNGTIDDVYYTSVPAGTTVDWDLDTVLVTTPIASEVFFKRIESEVFNSFRFYRYLDLLFKDLDGYVTVTVRQEREDNTVANEKTFSVGNISSGTVSPFQKKRISFLCKNQSIIIGLSNAALNETFSIAKYLLIGDERDRKEFSADKIISM